MIRRLFERDLTVGELAQPLAMSLAAASKHVMVLEQAGLVRKTVSGRKHVCRLEPGPLASASEWTSYYSRFWEKRLDALDTMFRTDREPIGEEP